ncbi:hypothetical protein CK203_043333 [Vitis vinifera]|uniref:Reverse transcriptase zinc-binding domain-containing protein n=1 Tax=Vitis vinifera TaxID=29760 RepID=A0A438GYE2_VITVI|nr:hypothetical protein CK203_043333 [Vitis vinifera]
MSTELCIALGWEDILIGEQLNSRGAAGGVLVFWDNKGLNCWRWKKDVFNVLSVQELYGWDEGGRAICVNEKIYRSGRGFGAKGLSFTGGPFTWRGGLNNQSQSRLDRWRFEEGSFTIQFENMWLEEKGFMDQMKRWWGSLTFIGSFSFVLDAKLRALKVLLKTWNKEVFGVIDTKKREALSQVVYWDELENHSTLSLEDCEARKEAMEAYKTWVLREEISWRQGQGNCG